MQMAQVNIKILIYLLFCLLLYSLSWVFYYIFFIFFSNLLMFIMFNFHFFFINNIISLYYDIMWYIIIILPIVYWCLYKILKEYIWRIFNIILNNFNKFLVLKEYNSNLINLNGFNSYNYIIFNV